MRMLTLPEHLRFASDLTEWDLILQTRANVLLLGSECALKGWVSALERSLDPPQNTVSAARWSLPSGSAGTLFIEQVAHCTIEQQHELLDWLDGPVQSVQVITTTEQPVFDLVECGTFLSPLYYRLNTVHITVDEAF